MTRWICCQIGAREHYAIPRALHSSGQLHALITDVWTTPDSVFSKVGPQSIRDRYHSDLPLPLVKSFNKDLLSFEANHKLRRTAPWPATVARNRWFQRRAIQYLESIRTTENTVLYTYSYAALELLRYAKKRGWKTVLGQIDPGYVEEEIVANLQVKHPELAANWQRFPQQYWDSWKQECAIADRIVVNSAWSKKALQQSDVPASKVTIVPLAYAASRASHTFQKQYPDSFDCTRPLRVLFLGQVILRKGIAALLAAAQQLQNQPVEFWIVGRIDIDISKFTQPNIRWIGSVSRSETAHYYQQADVFLFPTLSDGFGLTQLEAQSWKLPIIASRYCGSVVQDQQNGLVLPEVSGRAIAQTLNHCLQNPTLLNTLSQQSEVKDSFSLTKISQALESCLHEN